MDIDRYFGPLRGFQSDRNGGQDGCNCGSWYPILVSDKYAEVLPWQAKRETPRESVECTQGCKLGETGDVQEFAASYCRGLKNYEYHSPPPPFPIEL